MSTDDTGASVNDVGGFGDSLRPMEALDSDEIRNADGDETVDPPDGWSEADKLTVTPEGELEGESLERKLNAEEPDPATEVPDPAAAPVPERLETDDTEVAALADDAVETPDIDRLPPEQIGVTRGQVSGTPEDGDGIFPVVE
ncbi:hypothetical protein LV457_19655 [Mycobacterium sp. MYCO198283]|uniref:hypothetical protein n=1 Tax=Mycobacterium sp. MYCO198283 TaxID=2883505 RepID=UPI001E546DA3|nr:hypothetical protein [Mycobacterium sp. MYCO198283]MCG5434491.1 hypothetical protein [Mycobacterium sp. MYCO198283]